MDLETYRKAWRAACAAHAAAQSRFDEATGPYVEVAALDVLVAEARIRAVRRDWLISCLQQAQLDHELATARYEADPASVTAQWRQRDALTALNRAQRAWELQQHLDALADHCVGIRHDVVV